MLKLLYIFLQVGLLSFKLLSYLQDKIIVLYWYGQ